MNIRVDVAEESGWVRYDFIAPCNSDVECYLLPKGVSRASFWASKSGFPINAGRAMIWQVIQPVADKIIKKTPAKEAT